MFCGDPLSRPRSPTHPPRYTRGLSSSGNSDCGPVAGLTCFGAVGATVTLKPSCSGLASGTFTTVIEVNAVSCGKEAIGPANTTSPLPSRTVKFGAYPLPNRYIFAPSTSSGRFTPIVFVCSAASGDERYVTSAVYESGCPVRGPERREVASKLSRVKENGATSCVENPPPTEKSSYWVSVFETPSPAMTTTVPR